LHRIKFVIFKKSIFQIQRIDLFQLKNVDDFDHLKQLPNLSHISIRNNPIILPNAKRTQSINDIIRSDLTILFFYGHSQQSETKIKHVFKLNVLFLWFIFLIFPLFSKYRSISPR
jgi:hypothetical protein